MIHVDVRRVAQQSGRDPYLVVVETSVDGGPWVRQWLCDVSSYPSLKACEEAAKELARAFVVGARFAGAEVRGTAFGYGL